MSEQAGSRAALPGSAALVTPLLASAVVAVLLLWGAGNLSALLAHGKRLQTPLTETGTVAVRLARHPGDPAAAWPAADRKRLPGPVGFYATLAALTLAAGGLGLAAWHGWRQSSLRALGAGSNAHRARWATRRDLADLVVRPRRPLPGRIVLGRLGRATIATPPRHSVLLFGPTLSGKTTSYVVPSILGWRGPVIATSSKVDMLLATLPERQRRGRVWLLDPFGASGLPATRWSPLLGAERWEGALDMAFWLTQAGSFSHTATVQNAEFWETLGKNLLAPLLYAAANSPAPSMLQVVGWVNDHQLAGEVLARLDALQRRDPTDPAPALARSAFLAAVKAEGRRRDSIFGTAQVLLDVYKYPAVAATATGADLDREAFLLGSDGHGRPVDNTVYLFAPEHRQDQLKPLFEAFVNWLLRGVEDQYAATGRPLDPPLLLMLDEAGNIAPLRKLGTYASILASQGVQLVSVFQNYGQIKAIYGQHAGTVVTNHLVKVLMAGTTDRELLELLTYLLGHTETPQASVTYGVDGSRTATTSLRQRDLAPVHELVQQRPGQALVLLSYRKPARLHVTAHPSLTSTGRVLASLARWFSRPAGIRQAKRP